MVKVENKETLRAVTSRFMKMNRARNVIAVIAIILTSLLFTSLFVGSVSMILSKRATEIKQFMDSAHASAQNLSEEDAKRLQQTNEQSEDVKRYSVELGVGIDPCSPNGRPQAAPRNRSQHYRKTRVQRPYIRTLAHCPVFRFGTPLEFCHAILECVRAFHFRLRIYAPGVLPGHGI